MTEALGIVALLLGVLGVVLNNRRDIRCFYLWGVGTAITLVIHIISWRNGAPVGSLALRDAMFLTLNYDGIRRWRRK